jgi:stress response protein YsnF
MGDQSAHTIADRDLGDLARYVVPLSEHDELEIADGNADVRGWDVQDSAGRSIGYVYDLLIDLTAMRVRHLDVLLDPEFAESEADQRVLIPIENAALDRGTEGVLLRGIDAADVHALAPHARRSIPLGREAGVRPARAWTDLGPFAPIAEVEVGRETRYEARGLEEARTLEEERSLEERSLDRGVTLSEEELAVSNREVESGTVDIRKTVEIERRAIRPGEVISGVETRGDETYIPIMAEEVVVEKRLVAKEVLIIRKRAVTEERIIETDVRREQVHVDDPLGRVRVSETDRPRGGL